MSAPSRRRLARISCAAATAVVLALAGCADEAGQGQVAAAAAPAPRGLSTGAAGTSDSVVGDEGGNVFLPDEQNLDDCVGLLQRPGCGSVARGGWRQYLTMGVLAVGLAFIGWRISRGVRARDRVANEAAPTGRTAGD